MRKFHLRWALIPLQAVLLLAVSASGISAGDVKRLGVLALDPKDTAALLGQATDALAREPAPLAVVHTEGTLPMSPGHDRALQARKEWKSMAILANSYAVTHEPRFVEAYARYLTAWLDIYRISENPIDETWLDDWLFAYRSAGAALPTALSDRMQQFACELTVRYARAQPPARKSSTNNWQSHRVKLAVMGAHVCGNSAPITRTEAAFARQIRDNLLPNGENIDFIERDALHYVVYSIEPLLGAALFARLHGRSLYAMPGPHGQSLSRTLEWLLPYAAGEKIHYEFARSRVRFDAQRAAAGVPGFAGPFTPKKAQYVYWLAARLDNRWLEASRKLGSPGIDRRASWLVQ